MKPRVDRLESSGYDVIGRQIRLGRYTASITRILTEVVAMDASPSQSKSLTAWDMAIAGEVGGGLYLR